MKRGQRKWGQRRVPVTEAMRVELGEPKMLRRLPSSPRSRVWLVEFDGAPAIVKQMTDGVDADERYRREVTALGLAGRARPAVAPGVLAVDPGRRVVVVEYIVDSGPAPDWIVGYAATLARLHATTTATDMALLPRVQGPDARDVRAFLGLAATLGISVEPAASDELRYLLDRLDPADHHALLHGDPCPGNDLYTDGGPRFVDFEQAGLGNGLTELAYLRIGFPTCWCVTSASPELIDEAESAYRTTWRSITDSDPAGDLTDACVGWLIRGDALVQRSRRDGTDHLDRLGRRDWRWGTTSARGRLLHRLGVVAPMASEHAELRAVGRLCVAMAQRMRQRWPNLLPVPASRPGTR